MNYRLGISRAVVVASTALMLTAGVARAETPQAPAPAPAAAPAASSPAPAKKGFVPLKVQVTISRHKNEDPAVFLSRLPFTLWVNANDPNRTTLNVGMSVPIPQGTGPITNVTYQSIGTSIDCGASVQDDGRFVLDLTVSDTSVAPAKNEGGPVTIQSMRTRNFLLLRDGQRAEFAVATDKVTGEVTRVEVVVTVLK